MKQWILMFLVLLTGCSATKEKPDVQQTAIPNKRTSELRQFPLSSLNKVTIQVEGHQLSVYVADDPAKQQEGLMFLQEDELTENDGMIFVFPTEDFRGFWMKNTLINLDIAYLDKNGTILNILTMRALDESTYPSEGQAMYAVETKAGWFQKRKIKKGMRFELKALKNH